MISEISFEINDAGVPFFVGLDIIHIIEVEDCEHWFRFPRLH